MCRLLAVKTRKNSIKIDCSDHLSIFADISKNSVEYQGHGWGCVILNNGKWQHYKNISPIWEDDLTGFGEADMLIAHARSAFRDEGIEVENNMPFYDENTVFIFNGELQGVRIKEEGRIGAEKIYNFIKRFEKGSLSEALKKAVAIISKRTQYIRAMNIIMADCNKLYVSSLYNEMTEYFQMSHFQSDEYDIVCSDPYPEWKDHAIIENNSFMVIG